MVDSGKEVAVDTSKVKSTVNDEDFWHACAGKLVDVPPVNTKVYYIPQAHAEHASTPVVFGRDNLIAPLVACRVTAVKLLAYRYSDRVYAKIKLLPIHDDSDDDDDDDGSSGDGGAGGANASSSSSKAVPFAQVMTLESDSQPPTADWAEQIFPPVNYKAYPPSNAVLARDVHGQTWRFSRVYSGTPPDVSIFITGWSNFSDRKNLFAGDSVVFFKSAIEQAEVRVGIRRSCNVGLEGGGTVEAEAVIEAAKLASYGREFKVEYHPGVPAGAAASLPLPGFCLRASEVKPALKVDWSAGMRLQMVVETSRSQLIPYMGTVASVGDYDPEDWPTSPWRRLKVTWDEQNLFDGLEQVSSWMVDPLPDLPSEDSSPPSSSNTPTARKRPRLLE